jgi:hypothetical protein
MLPDELVLDIASRFGDVSTLMAWAITCRRHHRISDDLGLWEGLCKARFGCAVHVRAKEYGKDARWLYRAQGRPDTKKTPVGAVMARDHIYWGDLKDGLPHGYGVAIPLPTLHRQAGRATRTKPDIATVSSKTARRPPILERGYYEGQWHSGRANGHGKRVRWDGEIYEGAWEDGSPHGHGSLINPFCGSYVGQWYLGQKHGFGLFTSLDGTTSTEEWRNGFMFCSSLSDT